MATTIIGLNKLVGKLERLEQETLEDAMKKAVTLLHKKAKEFAPVDTGYLKRNILKDTEVGKNEVLGWVHTNNVEYAPYQEYGTSRQSGTPFMRPALSSTKDEIVEIFRNAVSKHTRKK